MSFPQRLVRPATAFSLSPAKGRKRPRMKVAAHLKAIRACPCCACLSFKQIEAAHIRMPSLVHGKAEAGIGAKPDDSWVVPLCAEEHREQHKLGEPLFWANIGIDPFVLALALWRASGDADVMEQIVREVHARIQP